MYEDKRTIQANGLLSRGKASSYKPKPINVGIPQSITKPDPRHTNPDREKMAQHAAQRRQEEQAAGAGKIICCAWYALGRMPEHIFEADQAYGRWLLKHDKEFMQGYLRYAPHIVKHMHGRTVGSRIFIECIGPLVNPWGLEMAYRMGAVPKGSRFGSLLMWACNRFFRLCCKYNKMKLRIKKLMRSLTLAEL
jgi:hypothetical protein